MVDQTQLDVQTITQGNQWLPGHSPQFLGSARGSSRFRPTVPQSRRITRTPMPWQPTSVPGVAGINHQQRPGLTLRTNATQCARDNVRPIGTVAGGTFRFAAPGIVPVRPYVARYPLTVGGHQAQQVDRRRLVPCKYYAADKICMFGDACAFLHAPDLTPSVTGTRYFDGQDERPRAPLGVAPRQAPAAGFPVAGFSSLGLGNDVDMQFTDSDED